MIRFSHLSSYAFKNYNAKTAIMELHSILTSFTKRYDQENSFVCKLEVDKKNTKFWKPVVMSDGQNLQGQLFAALSFERQKSSVNAAFRG
jgi:hypothetical protein